MSRSTLIALLLGVLLVAAPFARADDEYEDEEAEGSGPTPVSAEDPEKDVLVLTKANFDETIKTRKFVLAEFYAPWCGHCKSLAPHYAKAATALKSYEGDVALAKIDATVDSELAQKYGVQGYPTLKWFVDGELAMDYNGPREAEGIVNWIKKKTGPATVVVEDAEKLAELEKDSQLIVVGYFKELQGADYEAFKSFASKSEDAAFVETTAEAVGKAAGLEAPGVAAVKNFKGEAREAVALSGEVSAESLKAFVDGEKLPLAIEFNQENSDKIFNSGIKLQLILWAGASDLEDGSALLTAYKAVSKAFKGKLVFVTVNNEGASHEPVTNFFGLKGADSPVLMGFFMEKNRKYRLREALSEESIAKFAEAVLDGTAEVEFKSAPIPEEPKDEGVTIVVGKTVDKIVFDETKDVLLEVYAPWCGHCKALDPIYKKLAKRFSKVDSVVIAKMDGTENEHPEIEIKGFPTLFFVPAEKDAKPIPYDSGDRTLKALTKFIKQHAKVPYTLAKKGEAEEGESAAKTGSDKDEL